LRGIIIIGIGIGIGIIVSKEPASTCVWCG
jgi:hypothetical protein